MISMLKLRKIIQQLQNGKAIKQISKELRSSKNTIRKYKRRIDQSSKTYQEILSLNDEQLCNLLECQTGPFTTSDDRYPILASKMESYAKELKKPGVTKQTLWEEYRTEYPIGYRRAQFCEHITRYLSTNLAYKEQKGWDSDYFLNIMTKVGPNSKQITQNILTSRTYPEQSFSSCCGLIKLLKAYGNTRFENACTRALLGKTHTYLILKNILEKNLDKQLSITFNENYIPNHENIRGHKSYL